VGQKIKVQDRTDRCQADAGSFTVSAGLGQGRTLRRVSSMTALQAMARARSVAASAGRGRAAIILSISLPQAARVRSCPD
jgi:hypothetical protein